jgi:hypothetical protein
MVRKSSLFLGLFIAILLCSFPARAQEALTRVEVYGGYAYERFNPPGDSNNLNGWDLSVQYKFAPWIGGVADFGGEYGTISGASSSSVHTFLFGPQVSFPARVSPFAHVLIGGGHISLGQGGPSDTAFTEAIGVGIDAHLVHGIAWRVIQGDYVHTGFFGGGQNNGRISTGIVFRF